MAEGEMDEIGRRVNAAVLAVIRAASQLAGVVIEARIAQLQRAAQHGRQTARQAAAQARAWHAADAAVWREAMRPRWWRTAGAADIAAVWRAASTWHHVDPRAAAARRVVVARLAERGVHLDPASGHIPQNVAWLSDVLDRAAAAQANAARAAADAADAPATTPGVVDGDVVAPEPGRDRDAQRAARDAERSERAAAQVRAVWSPQRAQRVIDCEAFGALAYRLDELAGQGHDVTALLRGVDDFIDRAHTPAAFAARSVTDAAAGMVDLGTVHTERAPTGERDEQAAADGQRAAERDDQAGQRRAQSEGAEPAPVAQARTDVAGAAARVHADRAAAHEARAAAAADGDLAGPVNGPARAAAVVAQGYPTSTREAVAAGATAGTGAGAARPGRPALPRAPQQPALGR